MIWDYCVVGNGLLGAAIAFELSRDADRVCIVGAKYGDEGVFFSAHEDDSRIARQFHGDVYWEGLVERNMGRLHELTRATGMDVFRSLPVLYRFRPDAKPCSPLLKTRIGRERDGVSASFSHEDIDGGVINPKVYVAALNMATVVNGAEVRSAAVQDIERSQGCFKLRTRDAEIMARYVVDARGFHQPNLSGDDSTIVGKTAIFVEVDSSPDRQLQPFCFIAAEEGRDLRDVYGFHQYRVTSGKVISKFGVSEREPVRLTPYQVSDWFRGGYRAHPVLDATLTWIGNFLDCPWTSTIKPCAFVSTASGRPQVRYEKGLLTIKGCNGMAAKCCQALAEDVVATLRRSES